MTFVTQQQTTWGDLREGEQIVDRNDVIWTLGKPEPIGSEVRVTIEGRPNAPLQSVVVVKPATDTVTVIREAPSNIVTVPHDQFEELMQDEPTVEEQKATVEAAMGPTTEILPIIDTALELRSHLYLLHGLMIHEATTRAALLEHHRRSHQLEAEGNGEAGATPHVHEEEKQ